MISERKLASKNRGFSLIEVIVAMAILAGGVIVVGNAWSGNNLRIRKANLNNNVALLLERKMTEIEVLYKQRPLEEIPESDGGDFGDNYPQYSWTMTSRDFEMPNLSALFIGQEGGASEMMLTMVNQLTEYISQTVKEVTVTISVKVRDKTVDYSATSYMVDYDKEVPIGGGVSGGGVAGGGAQ